MPLAFTVWLHSLSIVVAAYLLGSIPTGYLLVRFVHKQDIRTMGSGNIGAPNVLRSGAKGLGAATFLFDVMKGAMAVLVGARLATIGFPIVGDTMYGGRIFEADGFRFERQALHAHQITFVHPGTLKEMTLSAPLPADIQMLIGHLEKLDPKT